jgi:hypothetical protein
MMPFQTLSRSPEIGSPKESVTDSVIETSSPMGKDFFRQRSSPLVRRFVLAFNGATLADYLAMLDFEQGYAGTWTTWTHPLSSRTYKVRLAGPVQFADHPGILQRWDITVTLEAIEYAAAGAYGDSGYGIGIYGE